MGSLDIKKIYLLVSIASLGLCAPAIFSYFSKNEHTLIQTFFISLLGISVMLQLLRRSLDTWSAISIMLCNTASVVLTGLQDSFFSMLYLPLGMLAAMHEGKNRAMSLSVGAMCLYIVTLLTIGHVPINKDLLTHVTSLMSGLILVVYSTSYLVSMNKIRDSQLHTHHEQLQNLVEEKTELLKKLSHVESILATHDSFVSAKDAVLSSNEALIGLTGKSVIMQKVQDLIQRVAPTDATVLISGPSGTGKEVSARAIHRLSQRMAGPLVVVNCGAIPEQLLESELFGHRKGSFTGAIQDHKGLFLEADHGTLFLDEIGELPLHLQAKLLRALQEKSIRAVGATKDTPIDVRIIAATNRNLKEEVSAGRFREDLYYRLNVVSVVLPALAERAEDIPLLVHASLKKILNGRPLPEIPPMTLQKLLAYNYPGNVRELENILERALVFNPTILLPDFIPEPKQTGHQLNEMPSANFTHIIELKDKHTTFPVNLEQILDDLEKAYIVKALEQSHGVKKKAAELLGINGRSFRYRCEKHKF